MQTRKISKCELLQIVLSKLPKDIANIIQQYLKFENIEKVMCIAGGEVVPVDHIECAEIGGRWIRKVIGCDVIGELPFDIYVKYNYFTKYLTIDEARHFFTVFVKLPNKHYLRGELEYRGHGLTRKLVYEDEKVAIVEESFYDDIDNMYYIYEKIETPVGEYIYREVENIHGWDAFKTKYPELAESIKISQIKMQIEKLRNELISRIESLRQGKLVSIDELKDKIENIEPLNKEIEQQIEELKKLYNEAKELSEKVFYEKMKEEEEKAKRTREEYELIMSKIKTLPVTIVKNYFKPTEFGYEFEIVVRVGNGKWLSREEFNSVVTTLKQLGFKYNPNNKTWYIVRK